MGNEALNVDNLGYPDPKKSLVCFFDPILGLFYRIM